MNYRFAREIEGRILAGLGKKQFLPHLVCSWALDPASHRLSCACAPPAAGHDVPFLSPRFTATILSSGFAQARS